VNERALLFGADDSLVGVLTTPEALDAARPVLILLNAGLVHRVGPQRLHVMLARQLAREGFATVRFDLSGIGDSLPRADGLPFRQSAVEETRAVMDAVTRLTGSRTFCIMGLSSGALVSLAMALEDPRVAGVGILNPHGFAVEGEWGEHVEQLSAGRIYAGNLLKLDSWRKFLTGRTNYRRLGEALWYRVTRAGKPRTEEVASVADGSRPALEAFFELSIRILLLFSEKDRSLDNLNEILGAQWRERLGPNVEIVTIRDANHTFSSVLHLRQAVEAIERWMVAGWSGGSAAGARDPA